MTTGISDTGARICGSDAPELRTVRLGYIPLTDCASVIVAARLGFDRKYGITLLPSREMSWAALRDKLLGGALHAAHMLYGLVYGIELGIAGPARHMAVLMTLNQNGQAITLSNRLRHAGVLDGETLRQHLARSGERPLLAHTFPTGTHAMYLYYWLAAHGIDPLRDIRAHTVPPSQMEQRLALGELDGYSAGEPWHARAVQAGIGFTAVTSQAIWPDHPEKVLATTREFARRYPNTARALLMALLEAARYIDAQPDKRAIAALLSAPDCLDMPLDTIAGRLQGDYDDGLGRVRCDPHPVRFFADGEVPYPYLSDAMWFMSQHRRWGLLKTDPDYAAVARAVNQLALYEEAANALGIAIPGSPLRAARLIDGETWDGADVIDYVQRFPLRYREPAALRAADALS